MDATLSSNPLFRRSLLAIVVLLCAASGCCNPLLVSQRYQGEPTCGDSLGDESFGTLDSSTRAGVPVLAWPNVALPRCLSRERWRAHSAQLRDDFAESLQPKPPPPTKPPHSRFHPLPTQPVFAPRPEYAPAQLAGVDPHHAHGEPLLTPFAEEVAIPIPVPDATGEPTWRDLPAPQPAPSASEGEPLPPPTEKEPPPAVEVPSRDPSRGTIAPTSYLRTLEPNPLRPTGSRR